VALTLSSADNDRPSMKYYALASAEMVCLALRHPEKNSLDQFNFPDLGQLVKPLMIAPPCGQSGDGVDAQRAAARHARPRLRGMARAFFPPASPRTVPYDFFALLGCVSA